MRSIRDIRNKARRDLHAHAKVPAIYISPLQNSKPRLIEVRLHTNVVRTGVLNRDRSYAEEVEIKPRVISFQDQLATPRKGGIFSFSEGEAYQIEVPEPADGETITSVCFKLLERDTRSLPFPLPDQAPDPIPVPGGDPNPGTGTSDGRLTFPILTPSSEWVLKHNLNRYPEVLLLDPNGNEFEADVTNPDKNTTVVGPLFPAISGTAILS